MVTDYVYYLKAYNKGNDQREAVDQHGNHAPSSEGQLAAHAIGLDDWRNGHGPRSRSQLIHEVRKLTLSDDKPKTNIDLVEANTKSFDLKEAAGTLKQVAGMSGFTPAPNHMNAGRVEEVSLPDMIRGLEKRLVETVTYIDASLEDIRARVG